MPTERTTKQRRAPDDRVDRGDGREPPSDDQSRRLLAAILEFSALLRRPEPSRGPTGSKLALGSVAREHGLEQRHMNALLTIALHGPMTVTQLARHHHVALKTASLVAVELERAGLVERREDPADRRRTILSIAKSKQRAVEAGLAKRSAQLKRTLVRLTPAQREGLIVGLQVLAEESARGRSDAAAASPKRASAESVPEL